MNALQKRTLIVLAGIGVLYFVAFIWPNSLGARTETMLIKTSIDEPITYPYVVRMVTPPHSLREAVNRWLIYGDYHYGYPFYFLSAVSVLPVVLWHGALFENFTQINLLLLRQLISVLPMILAVGLLVFAQTRFRSLWKSSFLFIFLLTVPALVRNNIQWWHPDALSVLAVVVTLYLLDRDRLRFGRNFWLAAVACAIAIGIKLAGIFFAPVIALYLGAGFFRKHLTLGQTAARAGIFLGIMLLALLVSNPFLLNSGARQELVKIQTFKNEQLNQGYSHDDPYYYQKGPYFWDWTLRTWYGAPWFLGLAALSLIAGCFWGARTTFNRLLLVWTIPYSIYLLWFVAVKPDHYWLPVLIPVFSGLLNLWDAVPAAANRLLKFAGAEIKTLSIIQGVLLVALVGSMAWNIARPYSGVWARYQEGITVETRVQ